MYYRLTHAARGVDEVTGLQILGGVIPIYLFFVGTVAVCCFSLLNLFELLFEFDVRAVLVCCPLIFLLFLVS